MKKLLLLSAVLIFSTTAFSQNYIPLKVSYSGTLGKSKIVMTIDYGGTVYFGTYYYTDIGKEISFRSSSSIYGAESGDSFIMPEYDKNISNINDIEAAMKKTTGRFIFSYDDMDTYADHKKLNGQWVSAKTGKIYPVHLTRTSGNIEF